MHLHEPNTPAAFRARLKALSTGDKIHTGVVSPWEEKVGESREETVTTRGRLTITTDRGRYWFTGRELSGHNPLAFPRVIYRIPGGEEQ